MDINGSQPQINVNPFAYESYICPECGCEVFVPGVIFKKIPGIALGQGGGTVPFPLKVAICSKCGTLAPFDKEQIEQEEKKAKQVSDANKSGLII